jgi:hypothetical protein
MASGDDAAAGLDHDFVILDVLEEIFEFGGKAGSDFAALLGDREISHLRYISGITRRTTMKQTRRHRHLRPRPTRSQINQQIQGVRSTMQAFQLEWILEAQRPERNLGRLRLLHDAIVQKLTPYLLEQLHLRPLDSQLRFRRSLEWFRAGTGISGSESSESAGGMGEGGCGPVQFAETSEAPYGPDCVPCIVR